MNFSSCKIAGHVFISNTCGEQCARCDQHLAHDHVMAPGVGLTHVWCRRCHKYFGDYNPDNICII